MIFSATIAMKAIWLNVTSFNEWAFWYYQNALGTVVNKVTIKYNNKNQMVINKITEMETMKNWECCYILKSQILK